MPNQSPNSTSRPLSALAVGLLATLAVAGAYWLGLDHQAELATLDARFRLLGHGAPDERIVHLDIDDASLSQLGRWPWPRQQLAEVIDVLAQCKPLAIALDIELPEGQETRLDAPQWSIYTPGAAGEAALAGRGQGEPTFDDLVLRHAIDRAGNVLSAFHLGPATAQDDLADALLAELSASGDMSFSQAVPWAAQAHTAGLIAQLPSERQLYAAYMLARSRLALGAKAIGTTTSTAGMAHGRCAGPVPILASASGAGFVSFDTDEDGVLRRVHPLGADKRLNVYPHLGLAVAMKLLDIAPDGPMELRPGLLTIGQGRSLRRIPLGEQGRMLINWPGHGREPPAISAAGVGAIARLKRQQSENARLRRIRQAQLAEMLGNQPFKDLLAQADKLHDENLSAQRALALALLYDPAGAEAAQAKLAQTSAAETRIEQRLSREAQQFDVEFYLSGLEPQDSRRAAIEGLVEELAATVAADAEAAKAVEAALADLGSMIEGKVVLVGSTATGAPDFVHSPIEARLPGVRIHSAVAGTILSGDFIRRPGRWADLAIVLAAGALVSLVAATRPVLQAAPMSAVLAVALVIGVGMVGFGMFGLWLAAAAPLGAMLGSFLCVTAYRQLTEERAKRQIRGMFAHALSPALVDELIANPQLASLGGEHRRITCFFADIAGFTRLSETLSGPRTVALLNRYFDVMTEVIQDRFGGYVNKFLGDGMLVLFGAPIRQDDHARRALQAAALCLRRVGELNDELAAEGLEARLGCRIGITTGEAMVGNCGSSSRLDYTAIGDIVNLASRLEGANKFWHSSIIADAETWRLGGGDGLLARPLGHIRVVGRHQSVEVVQVFGLAGGGDDAAGDGQSAFAQGGELFASAVEMFADRRFDEALETFEKVQSLIGPDRASEVYIELCRTHLAAAPDDAWDGAVSLTEK